MTTASQSNDVISIPLSKLILAKNNVRKTGARDGIEQLQASIAANGILQSLVVQKTTRGKFAVIAGQRRYLALSGLAGAGKIACDAGIPCRVVPGTADAVEISLTENVIRVPMHPADQFEAFRELIDAGAAPADIAARFGISETAVKQRLKLARVSPAVLEAYKLGDLTLEQVQAFAISDDHAAQDRVLSELTEWSDNPQFIRDALTLDEIPATDRRARFVSVAAYEEAGGAVRRDLFAEGDEGVFLLDLELLEHLALAKLKASAGELQEEGWKWVEPAVTVDRSEMIGRRVRPTPLPLSEEAATEQKRLAAEYQALFDSADEHDDETSDRLDALDECIDELGNTECAYAPEVLATAGAVVTIGYASELEILRGVIRPEDDTEEEDRPVISKAEGRAEYSALLVQSLTEAKSAAIGAALSGDPRVALAAVVHSMALGVFSCYPNSGSLQINARASYYKQDSTGACELQRTKEQWEEQIPGDEASLWEWCQTQDRDRLLELLAFCAACTVNAVQLKQDRSDSPRLTQVDRKRSNYDTLAVR